MCEAESVGVVSLQARIVLTSTRDSATYNVAYAHLIQPSAFTLIHKALSYSLQPIEPKMMPFCTSCLLVLYS